MNERRKTFGADLGPADDLGAGDFQPRSTARADPEAARWVPEEGGYASFENTSRGDTQRRHRTGRIAQLNLKVTPANRARFQAVAEEGSISMDALFEIAIESLDGEPRR